MQKSRKILSRSGLLKECFQFFKKVFPKNKSASSTDPSLIDCLMASVGIFQLKFPSLLQYDKQRHSDSILMSNLKNLYMVENPPSDTTMREKLDIVKPSDLRGIFKGIFACAQRGKVLEQYEFFDKHYLLALDGTSQFSSGKIHCDNCCIKEHSNGNKTYYHQALAGAIVHPQMKKVIPLAPEPITKQDGATKNDCEQNAAKRLLQDFRREHPHLKTIVVEDSLYSTGPHIKLLNDLDIRFIISAKPGNLSALFNWVSALDDDDVNYHSFTDSKGTHKFKFINNVPLNDSNYNTKVNFLEYWEIDKNGKTQHFSWITDIELTRENVELIMRGGRARWRIENETFNTLKNQGYNFEHNYGHGKKNLCSIMGMLMMLAFLMDQLSEICDPIFQKAKIVSGSYLALWERIRAIFNLFDMPSWGDLFDKIFATSRKVE
jgi:Transposase DDE domain